MGGQREPAEEPARGDQKTPSRTRAGAEVNRRQLEALLKRPGPAKPTCETCGVAPAASHFDAADLEHWFCASCWKDNCDWLAMRGKYAPKEKTR